MPAPRQTRSSRGSGAACACRRGRGGRPGEPSRGTAAHSLLDVSEVLVAVQSLYADTLKPFGRILRKRLAERAAAAGLGQVDIDMSYLRAICASCPWLRVEDTEGSDWAALFTCCPEAFTDIYSPADVYPSALWEAAAAYFESLDSESMVLPGGRYCCARELLGRRLPFLSGYSLGQVSHMVQLAISQKKLLGYLNGAVVPYARSGSMLKDQCAASQQECAAAARPSGAALAEWDDLRAGLGELMERVPINGSMPLSNIKRLFRSRFHLELSETALGHSKLSELLNDGRLEDVCFVKLQGNGYVVVHPHQRRARVSLSSGVAPQPEGPRDEGGLHVAFADADGARDASPDRSQRPRRYKVVNTFVEVDDDEEATATGGRDRKAPKRAQTAPVAIGSDAEEEQEGEDDEREGQLAQNELSSQPQLPRNVSDCGSPDGIASCSTDTSPDGAGEAPCLAGASDEVRPMYAAAAPAEPRHSIDSELSERAGERAGSPKSQPEASGACSSLSLSPHIFVVQRTFVHIESEPDTPEVSCARKAKTTTHAQSGDQGLGFGM